MRKSQGLTQKRLAYLLGVTDITVLRWEKNYQTPSSEKLIQLSRLFNVPLNYLTGQEIEESLSMSGFTIEQKNILKTIALEFRSNSQGFQNGLTKRQQDILSSLISEFVKGR